MGWTVWGSNPGGGEIFHTIQTSPGTHPASYTMATGSFQGVGWPGHGVNHPPPLSAKVKERVELYVCSSSVPSWQVIGGNLPLPQYFVVFLSPTRIILE